MAVNRRSSSWHPQGAPVHLYRGCGVGWALAQPTVSASLYSFPLSRPGRRVKFVAYAPYRLNVALLCISLYFFTQCTNVYINCMAVAKIVIPPHFIHENLACEYSIRRLRQQG